MASELQPLIDAIAARIATFSAFAGVEVLAHKPGNLGQQITAALKRGTGVVAIVAFGKIGRPRNQSFRPAYDPLRFFVRLAENAFLNQTGKHVLELAERVDAELPVEFVDGTARPWKPAVTGGNIILRDGEMEQLTIVEGPGDKPDPRAIYDGWDVPFATKFAPLPAQG